MQAVTLSWVADVKSFVTWTGGRVEPAGMLSRGARQGGSVSKTGTAPGDRMAVIAMPGALALMRF